MKQLFHSIGAMLLIFGLLGCKRPPSNLLQGYVEGEFVYVSSPLGGRLTKLNVQRGAQVKAGDVLFALEDIAETAARDEASHRLQQARDTLADAQKGKRPTEIEALQAQLQQGREALALSEIELARQLELTKSGAVAVNSTDQARSLHVQNHSRVEELEADLKTAALGMRPDAVAALEAEVKAREAALAKAAWDLSQKQQSAPQAGVVNDTLYRAGEMVVAGHPVVSLLPPANIKVRTFVPETRLTTLKVGDAVKVRLDGVAEALNAKVSFIAPQAEYTPPVIYSQENRSKLVFMIELRFDDAVAAKLHPGQPVDVEFVP
ncbi:MAG: HlyD family efflux transporter periplasmic adaptor subunit [Prosthecobacter sp.]|uniref:HlyD family secretion protein n=1 Tax=Prosthecobacter sp. TaxID=1965333 RepID=UPI0025D96D3F|nr:HlyD family efflux transporter periplasmic adaptor subunit [Prosthecobacter sp.]MCF7787028.1 HlyD family efflux transporter periplasmic adaptor subunit [Prosthecobacter sp.]